MHKSYISLNHIKCINLDNYDLYDLKLVGDFPIKL